MNEEIKNEVNHPDYYNTYPVEAIDMAIRIWGVKKMIDVCYVTAFFYRMRVGKKDDISKDLAKEEWWINKAKELERENISDRISRLEKYSCIQESLAKDLHKAVITKEESLTADINKNMAD